MQVLPKILYIFCTLLIPMPLHYLASLKSILKTFIWKGKRARCSCPHLIKHRQIGGFGLPNINDYLYASQHAPLRHWFQNSQEILWSDIETTLTSINKLETFKHEILPPTYSGFDASMEKANFPISSRPSPTPHPPPTKIIGTPYTLYSSSAMG